MSDFISSLAGLLVKSGIGALFVNEVRGLVLAGPVIFTMYRSGGAGMAMWLGFCSLAGIAISVVAPILLAKRLKLLSSPVAIRRSRCEQVQLPLR